MEKRDRRKGSAWPCLKPTNQNPGAVTLARVTAGLEQKQLAEILRISPSYMSEIEKGTRSVSPARLHAIASACGCDVEEIVNPGLAEGADAGAAGESSDSSPSSRRSRKRTANGVRQDAECARCGDRWTRTHQCKSDTTDLMPPEPVRAAG